MLSVRIDVSDIIEMAQRAERSLDSVDDDMLDLAEQAAEHLQTIDHYQDRTGNLRKSTRAVGGGIGGAVKLEMAEEYASYVHARGFSNFDDVAKELEEQIDTGIDRMLERI